MLFKMIKDFIVHANRSHALGFTCSKEFPEAQLIGANAYGKEWGYSPLWKVCGALLVFTRHMLVHTVI